MHVLSRRNPLAWMKQAVMATFSGKTTISAFCEPSHLRMVLSTLFAFRIQKPTRIFILIQHRTILVLQVLCYVVLLFTP
jgi:hypothetical protein